VKLPNGNCSLFVPTWTPKAAAALECGATQRVPRHRFHFQASSFAVELAKSRNQRHLVSRISLEIQSGTKLPHSKVGGLRPEKREQKWGNDQPASRANF